MGIRLFIIAAIVLSVFAIIGTAAASGTCLGVSWSTWLAASLLAYFADVAVGGWVWNVRGPQQPPQ